MEHISQTLKRLKAEDIIQIPIVYDPPDIKMDYATFSGWKSSKGSEKALSLFRELADNPSWYMLLCYGDTGCGKTHLCEALATELQNKGQFICVLTWGRMISVLKNCLNQEVKNAYDAQLGRYCKAARLIVDDVGMETTGTGWEWGVFNEIINTRYENKLLTVCTTNLDIKELPDRAISRFRDKVTSRIVLNGAEDYRPKKC